MSDQPVISLKGVGKTYDTGAVQVRALDGVDLDVNAGEFLTITGPSGSGKSTLLQILGCLDHITEGAFDLAGNDVARADDDHLSSIRNRHLGFVFQKYNLLGSLTVLENIALPLAYSGLPRKDRQRIAKDVAANVGLADRLHHRPSELSGGQAQRVAIARALVHDPDILLADEPTGALDSKTGIEILELFQELNRQGRTVIMVTHDQEIARAGTRNIRIKDGRIETDTRYRDRAENVQETETAARGAKGLKVRDLLRIGIKEGLLAHKTRTALTMLGVIIGTASVIAMSSFSEGSNKKQADQIRALGSNMIRVLDDRPVQDDLLAARVKGSMGLSRDETARLQQAVPGITSVAVARELNAEVHVGRVRVMPRLQGVAGEYLEINNLEVEHGRYFSPREEEQGGRVVVLGAGIAQELGVGDPLTARLMIGGELYDVVGVLRDRNVDLGEVEASGVNDANLDLLMPLQAVLQRTRHLAMRSELDEIILQVADEDMLVPVGRRVRRFLAMAHHGVEDFQMIIPMDLLKTRQESQRLMRVLSITICAISLVVGGIGIMNIMLASVTERLREIGIRRSVGATQRDIRLQFLIEAVLISFSGGIIGLLLAIAAVFGLSFVLELPIVFAPVMLVVSVSAAVVTGLGFGYYPAAQAASQNLVDVLSYE